MLECNNYYEPQTGLCEAQLAEFPERLSREGRMPPKSRLRKWIPLTIVELIGFLAIVIIINDPSLED